MDDGGPHIKEFKDNISLLNIYIHRSIVVITDDNSVWKLCQFLTFWHPKLPGMDIELLHLGSKL